MNKLNTQMLSILFVLFSLNSYSQNPIIDSVITKTLPPDTLQVTVYGQLPHTGCTGIPLVMTQISFPDNLIDIGISIDCPDTGTWIYTPFTYTSSYSDLPSNSYSLCCHLCTTINYQIYCDSTCKTVVMSTNNIYDQTEYFFTYPNPTTGSFTLSVKENIPSEVFIYNSLGQLIYQSTIINNQSTIDLSSRPRGIYFLKVQSGENIYTEKIILQ